MEPRVAIGVPVYNGERHLEACLDSLLAQTYADIEILISDNASTDRTPEICRVYQERDRRVRYHRHPRNIGAAANFNFLPGHTRSELFKWAAHDDFCAPEFVERCVAALDRSPDDVLAFPRTVFVDDAGETVAPYDTDMHWRNDPTAIGRLEDLLGDVEETLLHKCTPQFGVVRRSALERTGLMGAYNSSDLVLLVELALLGGFAELDEYLFFNRDHEGSASS
jgi:glycosyltransferase involved in cell wall biosynthesis